MASQFSKDGQYFAQLTSDGKLKIWETATSKLEQEFTPDYHLTSPCTCLQFIQPITVQNGSPRKKKRRNSVVSTSANYIILGTTSGLLLVYSLTRAELDTSIDSETGIPVSSLSWQEGTDIYSAAEHTVFCWDIQNKTIKSKWKAGNEKITAILKLPEANHLLTASKNIKLWDISNKELLKTYTGHSSDVAILNYVSQNQEDYFISGSKADRILSCWSLNGRNKTAVANFSMEDIALSLNVLVDANGTTNLATVTRSGVCHIYQHILNGKGNKPLKPKTTLQIASDSNNGKDSIIPIPIVSALFKDEGALVIVHGTTIKLVIESVAISQYEKVQCLIRSDSRQASAKNDKEQKIKTKTPLKDNTTYLTPHTENSVSKRKAAGTTTEVPMEKRLENLTLNKLDSASGVPSANNVAQLLLQGIHSKDQNLLRTALRNRDETVIKNTIKRLPMPVIVPLVEELTVLIQGKTQWCQMGSLWLKHLLQVHAGLLVSNPELNDLLGPVLGSIKSRLNLQMPLSRLKGRLELLVTQINVSPSTDVVEHEEALLVYNDNDKVSNDSDMEGMDLGVHSESDNEWVEDSDENVDENSDEDMSS